MSVVQKFTVLNLSANSAAQSNCSNCGQVKFGPGYYDVLDLSGIGAAPTGSNSNFSCGTHNANSIAHGGDQASVCFKPGLYVFNTGIVGSSGTDLGSVTVEGAAANATGSGVTFVVGTTFLPKGPGGGAGGLAFDCCANDTNMVKNYMLVYHLGGCALPYSDTANRVPQSASIVGRSCRSGRQRHSRPLVRGPIPRQRERGPAPLPPLVTRTVPRRATGRTST